MHLALSLVIAAVACSVSDWLFFGVLFHRHYLSFPEVWRRTGAPEDYNSAVLKASLISALTPLLFVLFCAWVPITGTRAFGCAGMLWAMIPLPLLIANHLFIKLHPAILLSHGLGWLSKLMLSALVVFLLH